jgi:uncharacterized protein YjbJ (UPF0337 family)
MHGISDIWNKSDNAPLFVRPAIRSPRARPASGRDRPNRRLRPFAWQYEWNSVRLRALCDRSSEQKERIRAMNWDRIEGNWKEFKGKSQQKWGKLTDDDLDVVEGKRTELAGRLQNRYGYAKDQAEKEIDTWLTGMR